MNVMVCPSLLPQLSVPSSFAYLLCQVVSFFSPFSLFAKFIGYPQKDVHCHVVLFFEAWWPQPQADICKEVVSRFLVGPLPR